MFLRRNSLYLRSFLNATRRQRRVANISPFSNHFSSTFSLATTHLSPARISLVNMTESKFDFKSPRELEDEAENDPLPEEYDQIFEIFNEAAVLQSVSPSAAADKLNNAMLKYAEPRHPEDSTSTQDSDKDLVVVADRLAAGYAEYCWEVFMELVPQVPKDRLNILERLVAVIIVLKQMPIQFKSDDTPVRFEQDLMPDRKC